MSAELRGLGVSAGSAAGPAMRLGTPPALPVSEPRVEDTAAEADRAVAALAAVGEFLRGRADAASGSGDAADILTAEALMAGDPALAAKVRGLAEARRPAAWAIREALAEYRAMLTAAGGYLAERAADLDDIADRAVALLLGEPMPGIPDPGHPFVLLAAELAPADTATLDPAAVLAIVTERGGPTSHTAILAKTLGIPAVVSCPGIGSVADGTVLAVDGSAGTDTIGAITHRSAPVSLAASASASSWVSSSAGARPSRRSPRTPSAGLGSARCDANASGLSAPASSVRATTLRPPIPVRISV